MNQLDSTTELRCSRILHTNFYEIHGMQTLSHTAQQYIRTRLVNDKRPYKELLDPISSHFTLSDKNYRICLGHFIMLFADKYLHFRQTTDDNMIFTACRLPTVMFLASKTNS